MIDLEALKAKAKAATPGAEEWNTEAPASDLWKSMKKENAAYMRAVAPDVVLRMIERIETMTEVLKFYSMDDCILTEFDEQTGGTIYCESPDFEFFGHRAREALKAGEEK